MNYNDLLEKAEQGDIEAQLNISIAYMNGDVSGEPEIGKALVWLEKAANSNHPIAQRLYAYSREKIFQDIDGAFEWHQKAANNNDPKSQAELANYYYAGQVVEKNDTKALYWAKKAYMNGEENMSPLLLGTLYIQGNVVSRNIYEAYKYIKISAANGNELALNFKSDMENQIPQLKDYK